MLSLKLSSRSFVFTASKSNNQNKSYEQLNQTAYNLAVFVILSQNAKRASARKDTGLDQSLFSVKLFRLWISIIKVYKGSI